jgi:two-component system NtrC family sensor kinase
MRVNLSIKLVLATTLGIAVVLFTYSYFRLRRENEAFRNDMRRDHRALVSALNLTLSAVTSRSGLEDALEVLKQVDLEHANIDMSWVPVSKQGADKSSRYFERARIAEEVRIDQSGPPVMVTRLAFSPAGRTLGFIELKEPLRHEHQYVKDTVLRSLGMAFFLIALCAAIIYACVWYFVSRPIRMLEARLRRIGDGYLEEKLALRQRDEIGAFAQEINAMCERLAQSQAREEAETGAKIAALEQLRHADKLSTVGKLASGLAHELGTPLNVVLARGKMIATGRSSGAEAADDARIVVEQTKRMADIIRQLLDFARRRSPQKKPRNLFDIARRTLALLGPLAAKNNVELNLSGDSTIEANVDESQLEQVLTNLVMNAVQAQPKGGAVRVKIERSEDQPPAIVDVDAGSTIALSVEDDGQGMTEEVRERIFEPFFTTKEVNDGTGLGLSVSYGLVREHGGWIDVQSNPGRGSRFTVFLPEREI